MSITNTKNGKIISNHAFFWVGIAIFAILIICYFINISVDTGSNYLTYDTLLGIIIFHNPFILGIFILIGAVFVYLGLRKK